MISKLSKNFSCSNSSINSLVLHLRNWGKHSQEDSAKNEIKQSHDLCGIVMAKILLLEDDRPAATLLTSWLEHLQHSVEWVENGDDALDRLKFYSYDLAILDWNTPGKSGLEVCQEYRNSGGKAPILMLTSKADIDDKASGLYGGADDYVTKPYDVKELAARIASLLRRSSNFVPSHIKAGQLTMDTLNHQVYCDSIEINLLPKEYALLELFMRHPNQLLSPEQMLDKLWSSESSTTASVVKAHVHNLRKKLQVVKKPVIVTVHKVGYRLEI